jgi:hypothetical protein
VQIERERQPGEGGEEPGREESHLVVASHLREASKRRLKPALQAEARATKAVRPRGTGIRGRLRKESVDLFRVAR